jgi:hypothetical protein
LPSPHTMQVWDKHFWGCRTPSAPSPRCEKDHCWSEFLLLLNKMLNEAFPTCLGIECRIAI